MSVGSLQRVGGDADAHYPVTGSLELRDDALELPLGRLPRARLHLAHEPLGAGAVEVPGHVVHGARQALAAQLEPMPGHHDRGPLGTAHGDHGRPPRVLTEPYGRRLHGVRSVRTLVRTGHPGRRRARARLRVAARLRGRIVASVTSGSGGESSDPR